MFDLMIHEIIIFLLMAHFLADFPLQGDFLSKAKNTMTPIRGIDPWYCLMGHALIHSGAVYLITGSLIFWFVELFSHILIDHAKNTQKISFQTDQILHLSIKLCFVLLIFLYGVDAVKYPF